MKKVCDYCGSGYDDGLDSCPHCGAPNNFIRRGTGVPRTIEELKQWYKDANLPPEETTRFFIGRNYTEKRAFGIYKDESTGDFIVYKNKDNGQRAIRYQGKDEAYAVNELYLRLKEEITNQKAHQGMRFGGSPSGGKAKKVVQSGASFAVKIFLLIYISAFLIAIPFGINPDGNWGIFQVSVLALVILLLFKKPGDKLISFLCICLCISCLVGVKTGTANVNNGYYSIDDKTYYKRYARWYEYENDDWQSTDRPIVDNNSSLDEYYIGSDYNSSADYSDFSYSDASSWSSSDSWDSSSSWDSGSTDFSSDW